jgi:hypothetical protein
LEVLMPSYSANETVEGLPIRLLELSVRDRARIRLLVGHTLARIEREFILQTLRSTQGNRTYAANFLGISIRSLRDRLHNYRDRGESVPEPKSPDRPTTANLLSEDEAARRRVAAIFAKLPEPLGP